MDDSPGLKDPAALKHTTDYDPAKPFPAKDAKNELPGKENHGL
jgi:hypothetical protein